MRSQHPGGALKHASSQPRALSLPPPPPNFRLYPETHPRGEWQLGQVREAPPTAPLRPQEPGRQTGRPGARGAQAGTCPTLRPFRSPRGRLCPRPELSWAWGGNGGGRDLRGLGRSRAGVRGSVVGAALPACGVRGTLCSASARCVCARGTAPPLGTPGGRRRAAGCASDTARGRRRTPSRRRPQPTLRQQKHKAAWERRCSPGTLPRSHTLGDSARCSQSLRSRDRRRQS